MPFACSDWWDYDFWPAVALLHVEDANTPENMDPSLRVSPAPAFGVQLRVLLLQLVAELVLPRGVLLQHGHLRRCQRYR